MKNNFNIIFNNNRFDFNFEGVKDKNKRHKLIFYNKTKGTITTAE